MVQAANVLIGGGTGFVGRHLVNCLRSGGAKVRIITRKPRNNPDQISWNSIRDNGLPKDTTAVVNVAGRNILDPVLWTESFKREIYTSRIDSNRLLVKAIHAASNKPKAFVSISGVGFYEPSDTKEYDENWTQPDSGTVADKTRGKNFLMDLARDWEKSSELEEQHAPATRRVIIRAGVVIGRDGGVIQNLRFPFSIGFGGPIASGNQWFPWIHVDDLASMFKFAITNEHVTGVINGVAPEQVKNKDFAQAFGKALNRPAFMPLSSVVVKMMFGSERADILLKGQRVKSKSGDLGFRYQYPTLLEACRECTGRN